MSASPTAREIAPRRQGRARIALGARLARSGWMATVALVVAVVTTLIAVAMAVVVAHHDDPPLGLVAGATASALSWGAGVLLAFAAGAQALRRDRDEGVRELFALHGAGTRAYLVARVGGLAALLAFVVGGGALFAGIAATLAAPSIGLALRALIGTGGALVYAAAFASVMAPIAFAALGARTRAGGYLWLLTILVVPELLSGVTSSVLPEGWDDVTSIPGALAALRSALLPDSLDPARFARASVVLFVVVIVGLALVASELRRVDREGPSGVTS